MNGVKARHLEPLDESAEMLIRYSLKQRSNKNCRLNVLQSFVQNYDIIPTSFDNHRPAEILTNKDPFRPVVRIASEILSDHCFSQNLDFSNVFVFSMKVKTNRCHTQRL
jgi:hypothetical protein